MKSILTFTLGAIILLCIAETSISEETAKRPNILFITVDDMNADSIGVFGCKLKDTSPNVDRLASEGLRFKYAHVQVGNCKPSRNVMFSGRYPHNNRVEGFYPVRDPDYPILADLMRENGYFAAIRGKVSHSTPYHPYKWDMVLDIIDGEKMHFKNAESYYRSTNAGIAASKAAGKPFCLIMNISDPHKPFYGMNRKGAVKDPNVPSRVFKAGEVPIPGFLFDDPAVRTELAHYYSSVRRADDCAGAILKALKESGEEDNTLVMFLSDHGMPLPFAKTAVYHHSTHTPWIVRWPGKVKANTVDAQHMISAVDLLPTFLDAAGIKHPEGLDGRSFLPLLSGETQSDREMIFKEYNENAGGGRHPMRGVQTKKFGYIFNPWADGIRKFRTATTGTMTYRKMKELALTDEKIAARLKVFDHRVREEFYDYENDPDGLTNLIDDPKYAGEIRRHREALEMWMVKYNDHMLEVFQKRSDNDVVEAYMAKVEKESAERRKGRKPKKGRAKKKKTAE